jgi:uncharacterized protein with FMN-binding domain
MLRITLVIGGTVVGLVTLLTFKSHSGASTATPAAAGGSATGRSATGGSSAGGSPAAGSGNPGGASGGTPGTGSALASPGAAAGTAVLTGQSFQTKYGPMQVQVTLASRKIVKVMVLQQTNLGAYSTQIDARAIPQLSKETLAAQDASIDAVSGASYTSAGYIQSLQSALDQGPA